MRCHGGWVAVIVVSLGPWACRRSSGHGPVVPVIPSGQEALVARMLSAPGLPARCVLDRAAIDHDRILARYQCESGPRQVTLVHPTKAPPTAVRTAQFGLSTPDAPEAMLPVLAARIRAEEAAFRWAGSDQTQRR
jgi:hypothetical protein